MLRAWAIRFAVGFLLLLLIAGARHAYIAYKRDANQHYDRERFREIDNAIRADKKRLLGRSLDEVTVQLGLENVPWDEGLSDILPWGEERIYHFPGFYLDISLELLPPGITPDHGDAFRTLGDHRRTGVRWLAHFYPRLVVDSIDDPEERMKQFWKEAEEGFMEKYYPNDHSGQTVHLPRGAKGTGSK